MALDFEMQQKTICGYHKKDTGRVGIIEKKYPILENENEATFLVTRDHFFSISTQQIASVIKNFLRYKKVHDVVRILANIIIVPGIFVAVGFIFRYANLLDDSSFIVQFIDSKWSGVLFGLSILGVIILWHDFYEEKSHPVQLPIAKKISPKELDEIRATGFKFGRYAHLEIVHFTNQETLEMLCTYTKDNHFSIFELYKHLLTDNFEVQQLIRRSGIEMGIEELEKDFKVNAESLPQYHITAYRSLLTYAVEEALLTESKEVQPQHIFLAITRIFPQLQKFLQTKNITIDIFREICLYNNKVINKKNRANFLDIKIPYYRRGGIAKQWVFGYTFILSHFSKDLTRVVAENQDTFGIGHEEEIENLVSVLGKISNKNALLIGEAGVGKSSLILGVAQRINTGNVPIQLKDKRVVQFDVNGLIAQASGEKNIEQLIIKAMEELGNAGNTILYIDEMQELIPAKAEESGQSIAGVMLPYIMNSKFPIIGTINYADYKKYFYSNESLRQSFSNIEVKEVSTTDTLKILETKVAELESNFSCYITFPALVASVELAQRYIRDRKLPSSAVQTIEATCSWAQSNNIPKITSEHVSKAISIQKNINITEIDQEESNRLRKLEENIKSRIVGQDEAIIAITEALRRARTDIRSADKPIGTFLFIGPTGVGKTYLAKVVGEEFFGNKQDIIRIDMSEYQDVSSIDKFLGSSTQTNIMGQSQITLVDRVKSNPYTVVLFDEIEKAHPDILNLFLQIFDEGRLTSSAGETVDFTNTVIICTSNIGSQILLEALEKDASLWDEAKNRVLLELRQYLRPELLNRFDKVIVFAPHDINNLTQISELLLAELAKRLADKGMILKWNNQIPMLVANKSNEPGMGARPIKRYIQDRIEGEIAKEIIEGNLKSGAEINIRESWII